MRKCTAIVLLLALLAGAGLAAAHGCLNAARDAVVFREELQAGDPAAAEGLQVALRTNLDYRLFWDTRLTLGRGAETDFHFSQAQERESREHAVSGLYLDYPCNFGIGSSGGIDLDKEEEDRYDSVGLLVPLIRDVLSRAPAGEEYTETVTLRDYFEWFPLQIWLDVSAFSLVEENGHQNVYSPYYDRSSPASSELADCFRFPVPEDYRLDVTVTTSPEGVLYEITVNETGTGLSPYFSSQSVELDTGLYFTLQASCWDEDSQSTRPMDGSYLPGGFGIYYLPYVSTEVEGTVYPIVQTDGLRCVYSFPEGAVPLDFQLSSDGGQLLLSTEEEGRLCLRVFDLDSMALTQELALAELDGTSLRCVLAQDRSLLYLTDDNRFFLAEETAEGYVLRFGGQTDMVDSLSRSLYADVLALAFDGEKLALAFPLFRSEPYTIDSCSLCIQVYDASGLLYSAIHHSSLDSGAAEYSGLVRLSELSPIQLSW